MTTDPFINNDQFRLIEADRRNLRRCSVSQRWYNKWHQCHNRPAFLIDGRPLCFKHSEQFWEAGNDVTEHRVCRI